MAKWRQKEFRKGENVKTGNLQIGEKVLKCEEGFLIWGKLLKTRGQYQNWMKFLKPGERLQIEEKY